MKYYILGLLLLPIISIGQITQKTVHEILYQDSLFWIAYNNCDVEKMLEFIADDVEFYHDMGGIQRGKEEFLKTTEKNLCSNPAFKIKREQLKKTIVVFPMKENDTIYGAIMAGDHIFYIVEPGNQPKLDGQAKFTHLWLLKEEKWIMSRILSYDHKPAMVEGRE